MNRSNRTAALGTRSPLLCAIRIRRCVSEKPSFPYNNHDSLLRDNPHTLSISIGGGKKVCRHRATVVVLYSVLPATRGQPTSHQTKRSRSRRHLTKSYPKRIVDLTKVVRPPPTIERRMDHYSLEEPYIEEQNTEETARSRRAGGMLVVTGALIMALSMLGGWTPWS
jgi:hypothetical protein